MLEIEKQIDVYLKELNLDLADIEYVKEGGYNYLRIYIEKLDEITTLDDCIIFSGKIDDITEDLIKEKFFLEVSTPGIERRLKKEKDFLRFKGEKIKVSLISNLNGSKKFEGLLEDFINDEIMLKLSNDEIINIPLSKLKKANIIYDIPELKEEK